MAPRFLFVGAGSVGIPFAFALSRTVPPENIAVVCRSNYAAGRDNGFTVNSTAWGQNQSFRPGIVASSVADAVAQFPEPFDYIVVSTKVLPSTPSIQEQIRPAVSKGCAIVLFQNGINIEAPYAAAFPSNPILSVVVYIDANLTGPTTVKQTVSPALEIGTYPADAPESHKEAARLFGELYQNADVSASVHEDIQRQRWAKLMFNCSWNPVCALSRCRDANFLRSTSGATELVRGIMLEVASLAQAMGYKDVDTSRVESTISKALASKTPGVKPSMLADALEGRNMEVQVILGNVIDIAAEKGVEMPMLKVVYILTAGLDYGVTHKSD